MTPVHQPDAEPWALVHADGHITLQNLPPDDPHASGAPGAGDGASALRVYLGGVHVPVAYARTLDNDAVTFTAPGGVAWTAFHADGGYVGAIGPDEVPASRPAGLYFNADGQAGLFHACERPGMWRRPGARLRDQVTDAELCDALALARPRRRDDA